MARLVVTPCTSCGAPLEQDVDLAREARCPYCGTVTPVAVPTPPEPSKSGSGVGIVLGALFGALALLVGGSLVIEELVNRSNADRVLELRKADDRVLPTRATALPDGRLFMACSYDRVCVLDRDGKSLATAPLPLAPLETSNPARGGATHGMAADRAGRLYVSHGNELIEFASDTLVERRQISAFPDGEAARCLSVGPDDSLWTMTTKDDIVQFDSARVVRARWAEAVLKHDARHHGCAGMVVDASGRVWVLPEGAPAVYVLSPEGALIRRHTPGGPGQYSSIAVLSRDRVVLAYYSWLVFLDADFREIEGPKVRRDGSEILELLLTADDALVAVSSMGSVLRWEKVSARW